MVIIGKILSTTHAHAAEPLPWAADIVAGAIGAAEGAEPGLPDAHRRCAHRAPHHVGLKPVEGAKPRSRYPQVYIRTWTLKFNSRYNHPVYLEQDGRRRRSAESRRRIIEAATRLFVEYGFGPTTIGALAAEAGVSAPTVYYTFGSKEAVLQAAIDVAVAGDHEPMPTLERDWARRAIETAHPHEQVARMVAGAAAILSRAAALLRVLHESASGSQLLAAAWQENIRQRREVQRVFAEALDDKSALRPELSVQHAGDISALLLGPESYSFMRESMGWAHDDWVAWTTSTLARELLAP